ncbi:MAG: flagellar FlbD family protein [Phycisphaerales bacterium]
MIVLSRLNGEQFVLNAEIIRTVESTPDTTIRLTTGDNFMVRESMDEVIDKVVEYKRLLYSLIPPMPASKAG